MPRTKDSGAVVGEFVVAICVVCDWGAGPGSGPARSGLSPCPLRRKGGELRHMTSEAEASDGLSGRSGLHPFSLVLSF